MVSRQALTW